MATVQSLLDDLVNGKIGLGAAVADFENRDWPQPPPVTDQQAADQVDIPMAGPNNVDWIQLHPGLHAYERAVLTAAYDRAMARR